MSSSILPLVTTFPSTNPRSINRTQRFRVSCNHAPDDHTNDKKHILPEPKKLERSNVDRRNLLMGVGGLCTTANLVSLPSATATPIKAPDFTSKDFQCKITSSGYGPKGTIRTRECCPPSLAKTIKDFVFPDESKETRMRWPAHKGSSDQVDDYIKAIQTMRELPPEHPHSFLSQAKIHCAYCHGAYTQVGSGPEFTTKELQIHNSWLFFPFHRWYLYFYERILGKLIGKPDTFALPYWNWDNPAGMKIPDMFLRKDGNPNTLWFDVNRDPKHTNGSVVDLGYEGKDTWRIPDKVKELDNMREMRLELISNAGDPLSFFGGKYVAGDDPVPMNAQSVGSVEAGSHTAVHLWVGDPANPNREDMGRFYSAGYDPLFYVHHANVDRMWKVWKDLGDLGVAGHVDIEDPDWCDASYVFYDENEELVRVTNRDCVKLENLKYDYIQQPIINFLMSKKRVVKRKAPSKPLVKTMVDDKPMFPLKLNKTVNGVRVKRPDESLNRTKADKAKENEILVINKINFECDKYVKFEVFVNDDEYVGSFAQLPHDNVNKMTNMTSSGARFGLTELLEDTDAEGDSYVRVKLVPMAGCDDLTIGNITVQLVSRFST